MADISAESVVVLDYAARTAATEQRVRILPLPVATGLLLAASGVFFGYFGLEYRLGSMRSMGPGMFPVAGGVLLLIIGIAVTLRGLRSAEPVPALALRTLAAVLGSVVAFALTVDTFGLAVAAPLLIFGAVFATGQGSIKLFLALAIPLTIATILIFPMALGVSLKVFL